MIPVQHIPPANNKRSQRIQAVLTLKARSPLEHITSVHQLGKNLDRGPPMDGAAPFLRGGMKSRRSISFSGLLGCYPGISQGPRRRLGEGEDEEGEESVEEEESEETEVSGAPEPSEAQSIALSNQPVVS
ncbi:hypothetical protein O181_032077 [Austropuccinia psidii MF-1]|uniref:Uncharacterized protein n=1 Tax=Austropuccinia psidii MF-1 TaxID=1389203 RepID=A0A9Q3D1W9_9BASI|nr:hypothetical protein [Austropuccinia psidii MF-1]